LLHEVELTINNNIKTIHYITFDMDKNKAPGEQGKAYEIVRKQETERKEARFKE